MTDKEALDEISDILKDARSKTITNVMQLLIEATDTLDDIEDVLRDAGYDFNPFPQTVT